MRFNLARQLLTVCSARAPTKVVFVRRYEVTPLPGYDPVIGGRLWAMQQIRTRTLRLIGDLDEDLLDCEGPVERENSIGTLLNHIAEAEMGWLWWELRGHSGMPPEVEREFPFEPIDPETGWLSRVQGIPLADPLRRQERSRDVFLTEVKNLALDDWRTPRLDPEHGAYEATPEWMLFHLIAHEAEHDEQSSSLESRAPAAPCARDR